MRMCSYIKKVLNLHGALLFVLIFRIVNPLHISLVEKLIQNIETLRECKSVLQLFVTRVEKCQVGFPIRFFTVPIFS